jgi:hypothetical protein
MKDPFGEHLVAPDKESMIEIERETENVFSSEKPEHEKIDKLLTMQVSGCVDSSRFTAAAAAARGRCTAHLHTVLKRGGELDCSQPAARVMHALMLIMLTQQASVLGTATH